MRGLLRKRKKEPMALSVATVRATITLSLDVPDAQVQGLLGTAQIGNEFELEAAIGAPNSGVPGKAYVQEEYDELALDGGVRLFKVKVLEPGLPKYLAIGSPLRLRGVVALWGQENPAPFEGPACPA